MATAIQTNGSPSVARRGRKRRELAPIRDKTLEECQFRPLKCRLHADLVTVHKALQIPLRQIADIVQMYPQKLIRFYNKRIDNLHLSEANRLECFLANYVDRQTGIAFRDPKTGYRFAQFQNRPPAGLHGTGV